MRKWTYKSFLRDYVSKLSYKDSLQLNKLLDEAEYENPRLREVLLLYMLENYGVELTMSKLHDYHELNELYSDYKESLLSGNYKSDMNNPFFKVYHSFKVKRDYPKNREEFKVKLLKRINEIKEDKEISNYQVYTRLNLNHGNINYALKHLDPTKISEENLKRIYDFVDSQWKTEHLSPHE